MVERQRRVEHGEAARVIAPGASWTGCAVNLSVGGTYITGGPPLEVGRRLTVWLEMADGGGAIEAHARVAWRNDSGMGVRFLRIDDDAARRIAEVVDGHPDEQPEVDYGPVRVRLEGLPARLKAHAREGSAGTLIVEAELEWLRVGARIETTLASGRVCCGQLRWIGVEVGPSGQARLCLNVAEPEMVIEMVAEPEGG